MMPAIFRDPTWAQDVCVRRMSLSCLLEQAVNVQLCYHITRVQAVEDMYAKPKPESSRVEQLKLAEKRVDWCRDFHDHSV